MLGVLAACDDAPRTDVTFRLDDVWSFAQGAMLDGPLPVQILGSPYDDTGAALEDAVIGAMTEAITWTARPRFAVDAAGAPERSLRVVIALNGGGGGREQCLGNTRGGGPLPDGRVRVVATFCDEEDVLANVRGETARTDGVGDPRFSRLVRQVTRDMFIPTDGT